MFSSLRRLVGNIAVEEKNGLIRVYGIPSDTITRDISKIWETSKVNSNMFVRFDRSSFSFNSFFALDILYILETMLGNKKSITNTRAIHSIAEKLMEHTWVGSVVNYKEKPSIMNFGRLKELTVDMMPKQREFLEAYGRIIPQYNLNGMLLPAAPGTGKTLAGIGLSLCLEAETTIVACPNNAVYEVWVKTIMERFKTPRTMWVLSEGKPLPAKVDFIITHFEGLQKTYDAIAAHGPERLGKVVIILDECHNLNDESALRTRAFISQCALTKSNSTLWMSGTPIKALGSECIPMLKTIDPLFTPDTEWRFKKIYGKSASRAVDILKNRVGLIGHVIDKSEVREEKAIVETVNVKIPGAEKYTLDAVRQDVRDFIADREIFYRTNKKHYDTIYFNALKAHEGTLKNREQVRAFEQYKNYIKVVVNTPQIDLIPNEIKYCNAYELKTIIPSIAQDMRANFKDARSVYKYVHLKIQGEALGRIVGKRRQQCHVDMVKHAKLPDFIESAIKKTVVFTNYTAVLKEMEIVLAEEGYKTVSVWQETNKYLSSIIKKFDQDIDTNPLLATFKSLSTAVPLVMADVLVIFDSPFRDYILQQAIARLDRLGQDTQVYVYMLHLDTGDKENISTRSIDILQWSQQQVSAIMGMEVVTIPDISTEALGLPKYTQYDDSDLEKDYYFSMESLCQ